jgi:hypothetical protein
MQLPIVLTVALAGVTTTFANPVPNNAPNVSYDCEGKDSQCTQTHQLGHGESGTNTMTTISSMSITKSSPTEANSLTPTNKPYLSYTCPPNSLDCVDTGTSDATEPSKRLKRAVGSLLDECTKGADPPSFCAQLLEHIQGNTQTPTQTPIQTPTPAPTQAQTPTQTPTATSTSESLQERLKKQASALLGEWRAEVDKEGAEQFSKNAADWAAVPSQLATMDIYSW